MAMTPAMMCCAWWQPIWQVSAAGARRFAWAARSFRFCFLEKLRQKSSGIWKPFVWRSRGRLSDYEQENAGMRLGARIAERLPGRRVPPEKEKHRGVPGPENLKSARASELRSHARSILTWRM